MSDKQTINKISEDIICAAAAKAALEADGVIGFSDTLADNLTKMIAGWLVAVNFAVFTAVLLFVFIYIHR